MDKKYVKRPMFFGRFFVLMEIIPYICPKVFCLAGKTPFIT